MSNTTPGTTTPSADFGTGTGGTPDDHGTRQRASDVKDSAAEAGQHVAGVAKEELHRVGSETKRQAKDLYRQTQSELRDQAASQQKRVASGLRSLGDELGSMADSSQEQGVASDLVHQAATRASGIASWLDQRDPGSLVDELKGFARRRPGTFIAIAAVAGVVAGRLTRSVIAESKDSSDEGTSGAVRRDVKSDTQVDADRLTGTGVGGRTVPPLTGPAAATGIPAAPVPPIGGPPVTAAPEFGGEPR
ncbi:hypothetical protein [Cryobacterium sp. PAMC25264]|uniref:hypothetical protein n=1 Tax=Cryobacterium sp. PAMC25264 TaxID=2861288 RepID=UPI001C632ED5|nr:hypothetical protein [Cryobacterium sp. PAMC25264]QYF73417.1 hypothetical protein KY500_17145 [Cryobacterium sp. PAMC25264]